MIRRPPRYTLFPSPPLSLSPRRPDCGHLCGARESPTASYRRKGDRKSTRLNSSHSQISYAVFCLKKNQLRLQMMSGEQLSMSARIYYVAARLARGPESSDIA